MTAATTIGNFITDSLNIASSHAMRAAPFAAVGYLGARLFTKIDPRAGLLCAGVAVLTRNCTFNYQPGRSFDKLALNTPARIVGLVATIFLPFYICQKVGLEIGFKASLVFGAGLLAVNAFTGRIGETKAQSLTQAVAQMLLNCVT